MWITVTYLVCCIVGSLLPIGVGALGVGGRVQTVLGTGVPGFAGDGLPASQTAMRRPQSLVAAGGLFYFIDSGNEVMRRWDPRTGLVTTLAGLGTVDVTNDSLPVNLSIALLVQPHAVCADTQNFTTSPLIFYITQPTLHRVLTIDFGAKVVRTLLGARGQAGFSGDNGLGAVLFNAPTCLTQHFKGEGIYICDRDNARVRFYNYSTRVLTTVIGNGSKIAGDDLVSPLQATLYSPAAVVSTPSALYVSDFTMDSTSRIRSLQGNQVRTLVFNTHARAIAVRGSNLYFASVVTQKIYEYSLFTKTTRAIAGGGVSSARHNVLPEVIALQEVSSLFVSSSYTLLFVEPTRICRLATNRTLTVPLPRTKSKSITQHKTEDITQSQTLTVLESDSQTWTDTQTWLASRSISQTQTVMQSDSLTQTSIQTGTATQTVTLSQTRTATVTVPPVSFLDLFTTTVSGEFSIEPTVTSINLPLLESMNASLRYDLANLFAVTLSQISIAVLPTSPVTGQWHLTVGFNKLRMVSLTLEGMYTTATKIPVTSAMLLEAGRGGLYVMTVSRSVRQQTQSFFTFVAPTGGGTTPTSIGALSRDGTPEVETVGAYVSQGSNDTYGLIDAATGIRYPVYMPCPGGSPDTSFTEGPTVYVTETELDWRWWLLLFGVVPWFFTMACAMRCCYLRGARLARNHRVVPPLQLQTYPGGPEEDGGTAPYGGESDDRHLPTMLEENIELMKKKERAVRHLPTGPPQWQQKNPLDQFPNIRKDAPVEARGTLN